MFVEQPLIRSENCLISYSVLRATNVHPHDVRASQHLLTGSFAKLVPKLNYQKNDGKTSKSLSVLHQRLKEVLNNIL